VQSFKLLLIYFLLTVPFIVAQEKSSYGISFSGFVKSDVFFDTRQNVSIREGHFLLYPSPEVLDNNNDDINAKPSFNILSIQTRLTGKISAPDAFGAKTSGQIEGEFFGTSDNDINGFRLRHAFVKLDWANFSLLVGQTWHPMFVTDMFPGVVSFNTGVPFQPFSRNPQIRLTYSQDNLRVIAGALSQRDFQSDGPSGFSSNYLRNSVIPNLHLQFQYLMREVFLGAGFDYKQLTPRLVTANNLKTDETIKGVSYIGFLKLNLEPITIKLQGLYGQNNADLLQIGGYAVQNTDSISSKEIYTPLNTISTWGEVSIGKEIEYAIFWGYTKSLGSKDDISGAFFGRGKTIDNVYRLSPRIQFNSERNRISTEVEYTIANYGTPNVKGKVENLKKVSNLRLLVSFYMFF